MEDFTLLQILFLIVFLVVFTLMLVLQFSEKADIWWEHKVDKLCLFISKLFRRK